MEPTSLVGLETSSSVLSYAMQHNIDQEKTYSENITTPSDPFLNLELFSTHLRTWAIENRIPQIALSKLLKDVRL